MKCCTRLATFLYRVVSCCAKFDRDQTFVTKQMLYDTAFILCSRMMYDVVLVWPPHETLLHSAVIFLNLELLGVDGFALILFLEFGWLGPFGIGIADGII